MEKQALIPFTKEEYWEITRIAFEQNKGKLVIVSDSYLGVIIGYNKNNLIVGIPNKLLNSEGSITVSEYLEKEVEFGDVKIFDRSFDVDYFSEEIESDDGDYWSDPMGIRHIVDIMDSENNFKYTKMLYDFINPSGLQYPFDNEFLEISTAIDLVSEKHLNYLAIIFEFEDIDFNWGKKDCLKEINKFFQLYGINLKD